ncbi:hypothetical protein BD626DRAFT_481710 [Schizophyllum amplum]|uniref:DUF962-domain-containing protein n=1 Tax=Schizophyllum amplum TaxID=97359 RepID=A0A550CUH4_9AGAR|nr:hypothetical protein BD626DRAFT_481710 [Auriculariopsis ampla]
MSTKASLFDVKAQLTFYGAYHSNPVNVGIHMIFVPTIMWTAFVLTCRVPTPTFFPDLHWTINNYLAFDLNWPAVYAAIVAAYYFVLDPVAAFIYLPQMGLSLLTATRFAETTGTVAGLDHFSASLALHVASWLFQFAGHGLAEGRAPALLDNLLGAVVLAPFFVHLEELFVLGYRPQLHKELTNSIGVEITRIRKAQGEKRRAKGE